MNSRPRIAMALAALILGNLAIDAALVYFGADNIPAGTPAARRPPLQVGPTFARTAQLGTFAAQAVLIGLWLALGDAKWYWRVSGASLLLAALAGANWAGYSINLDLTRGGTPIFTVIAFRIYLLLTVSLAVVLVAAPLRELRGWRLTWQSIGARPARRKLHIADILLWMVPFGALLAAVRFLTFHSSEFGLYPGLFVYRLSGVSLLAIASGIRGFLHPLQRLPQKLHLFTAFVFIGLIIVELLWQINLVRVRPPGLPLTPTGTPATFDWDAMGGVTSYILVKLVADLNSGCLRRLGCELIGPKVEWIYAVKPPSTSAA